MLAALREGRFYASSGLELAAYEASGSAVSLELEGKRIAREGAAVLCDGKEVGKVTSGTFAPTLGKALAMAYVGPAHQQPGTACEVDIRGKPAPARVVPLPFYKRPK